MAQMSPRFNFDDFDEMCREALDERLLHESEAWEDERKWGESPQRERLPGEIGGVVCTPLYIEWVGDDQPLDVV